MIKFPLCHRHRTSDPRCATTDLILFFFTHDALQIADPSSKQDACDIRTLYRPALFLMFHACEKT